MSDRVQIEIPEISGWSEVVLRESAFVTLNKAAAEARVETVLPPITERLVKPRQTASFCDPIRTWTISGSHQTKSNGVAEIHMNRFLECISSAIKGTAHSEYVGSKPYFVATPESEKPVFLTATFDLQPIAPPAQQVFLPQAFDVTVKVMSWNHDGSPAPNVAFNWIAAARTASVTNI